MKRKGLMTLISLFFCCLAWAQNPPVSIATWKNNAQGAYNIIHDDFGDFGVLGIQNYADTMNYLRGLKFTFGAITASCEGNAGMYATAQTLISHGHEIINHSHNHYCAVYRDWCTTGLWAEPGTQDFATQMTYSSNSIQTNTGVYPRFFIYPYDLFNDAANNHLKSIGYIGSRTGTYDAAEPSTFAPDAQGFFKSALVVDVGTVGGVTKAINLNTWVDYAINNNSWVNRELHNVGSSGWGHVTVTEYRTHLDYLKQKVTAGQLWVGTVSEILTYQIQKLNYTPSSSRNAGTGEITVSWNTPAFNVQNYLNPLQYKSPITLNVDVSAYPGVYTVYQNGLAVPLQDIKINGSQYSINVYPHNGVVTLVPLPCSGICFLSHPSSQTVNQGGSFTLTVSAATTNPGPLTYQWYKDGSLLTGATSATYNVGVAALTHGGVYYVRVNDGTTFANSNNATITISPQTPFTGTPIDVPGFVQAENFDIGGQGIAYNETTLANQGNAPGYRTGPVDVETNGVGGHNVGYITNGEWLEYSINVTAAASYTFQFRIASVNTGNPAGQMRVELDGTPLIPTFIVPFTGGWKTWQTYSVSNVVLASTGVHTLRLVFETGNFNIDYVQVTNGIPLSLHHDHFHAAADIHELEVFPNPVSSHLSFWFEEEEELGTVELIDLHGRVVKKQNLQMGANRLEVAELPHGIYQLKIPVHNGYYYKKIVKNE